MKKIKLYSLCLTVIACVACCSRTQEKTKILQLDPDHINLTWRGDYDSTIHKMTYTSNWSGCGWSFNDEKNEFADLSEFEQVVLTIDSISTDTTTLFLNIIYTDTAVISSTSAPIVNGKTTLRIDLDPVEKSQVKEIYVMSKRPCEITINSAIIRKAPKYREEHELKVNDSFIDASEFDGYSDDALISFNYCAEGEMTFVSDDGTTVRMNNWGIGIVCASSDVIEAKCPGQRIILKQIGEQSYTCLLGDIRYLLDVEDDDGERGLYWVVWPGGNLTKVYATNATIREIE